MLKPFRCYNTQLLMGLSVQNHVNVMNNKFSLTEAGKQHFIIFLFIVYSRDLLDFHVLRVAIFYQCFKIN